jgi:hypothetical protein
VREDGCGGESSLQGIEGAATVVGKQPRSTLASKASKRNNNVGIIMNKTAVEVGEAKERLNVFNFPRLRPVTDGLDFVGRHGETLRRKAIAEIFDRVGMKLAFVRGCEKAMLAETAENFLDMHSMMVEVNGVDEDVIQIHYDANVEHVCEDGIDESLESRRSIGEAKGHNQPLVRTVARAEGGFPFITIGDANKVVRMSKVDFGIDFGMARGIEEVGD